MNGRAEEPTGNNQSVVAYRLTVLSREETFEGAVDGGIFCLLVVRIDIGVDRVDDEANARVTQDEHRS